MKKVSKENRTNTQQINDIKHIHYWANKVFWASRPDQLVALDKKAYKDGPMGILYTQGGERGT